MTGSGKTGLIAHDSKFDVHQTIKLHHQNQLDLSGLAAFPKHGGDLYVWSRALMELWSAWGWLYVAVQLRGVE